LLLSVFAVGCSAPIRDHYPIEVTKPLSDDYRRFKKISPPDSTLNYLANIYDEGNNDAFFKALDSIEIIDCTLCKDYEPPYYSLPEYEFEVENDSARVILYVIDAQLKLRSIIVNKMLPRGCYFAFHYPRLVNKEYLFDKSDSLCIIEKIGIKGKRHWRPWSFLSLTQILNCSFAAGDSVISSFKIKSIFSDFFVDYDVIIAISDNEKEYVIISDNHCEIDSTFLHSAIAKIESRNVYELTVKELTNIERLHTRLRSPRGDLELHVDYDSSAIDHSETLIWANGKFVKKIYYSPDICGMFIIAK
jgi:hypothetical protein